MIIKKLELHGFKSFAEKIRLKFHPGITCIIGPNGTGKSNIVDGLLWVLGGRSMKALRGEQRGDIIFNGNAQKAPMSMADVSIFLEEMEEEIQISHRIFRTGESEYRMDGKAVRLKDIQDELWKRGVGESQYFVIEQGQVGLFITSKPMEKRALLEEAAGTAFYKDKKHKAENKLANSEQNLIRLEDIIAEVSKAKNSLKRQAGAAIRYRKLREQIRKLTSLSFRKKIDDQESALREVYQKYDQSQLKEKTTLQKVKDLEKDLAESRKSLWEQEQTVKNFKENLYALNSKFSRLESEKDKEEKRIDYLEEKKRGSLADMKELNIELEGLLKEDIEIKSALESLIADLQAKQKELKDAATTNTAAEAEISKKQKSVESLRREQLDNLARFTEVKNESAKLEKEGEMLLRQEEKLYTQRDEAASQLKESKNILDTVISETEEQKEKLEKQRLELDKERKALESLQAAIQEMGHRLDIERKERDKVSHHLDVLEKLAEKERSRETSDLQGIRGILADFIESNPQHAALIDVFWKEEAKAALIESSKFLKEIEKRNIRGSFLLLHPDEHQSTPHKGYRAPEILGLLKTSIHPHGIIKKHMGHLNEAGIVKDVRTAVNVWIREPALNLITLDGDLLLSSGLLSLGKKKEGIFALNQEIKDFKEKLAGIDKRIRPLSEDLEIRIGKKAELKIKIQAADSRLAEMEKSLADLNRDIQIRQTDIDKIDATLEIIRKEIVLFQRDKDQLSNRTEVILSQIRDFKESEETLTGRLADEEKALSDTQQKTAEARDRYFELKSQIDLLEEKISNFNLRLRRIVERRNSINGKMESLKRDETSAEGEKDRGKENLKHLQNNIEQYSRDIKEMESHLHQGEIQFKEKQKITEAAEQSLDLLRKEYETFKEERVKWEVKKAEKDRDMVNLEESCWQELKKTIDEIKADIPLSEMEDIAVLEELSEANETLQKYSSVNLMAEEEYEIQKKRYEFLIQQQTDLTNSIHSTREAIKKIDMESKSQFLTALQEVNANFQNVFSMLFDGGNAEIYLTDPHSPLESGVEVKAQPPGKRVQSLSLLSGGEKTLSSLAFFFALFRYKPTPFCILDEVDAALDEANLARFLKLMDKIREQTQFIIITHNFKTMEVADYIYGTTMGEPNITAVYSVKMDPGTKQLKRAD